MGTTSWPSGSSALASAFEQGYSIPGVQSHGAKCQRQRTRGFFFSRFSFQFWEIGPLESGGYQSCNASFVQQRAPEDAGRKPSRSRLTAGLGGEEGAGGLRNGVWGFIRFHAFSRRVFQDFVSINRSGEGWPSSNKVAKDRWDSPAATPN